MLTVTQAILVAALLLVVAVAIPTRRRRPSTMRRLMLLAAAAVVVLAFAWPRPTPTRDGIAVGIDMSCDATPVTGETRQAIETALAEGVDGDSAVAVFAFGPDASTARRVLLDLTDPRPESTRGDTEAYNRWRAPRIDAARRLIDDVQRTPCSRAGTSVVGALNAAGDLLDTARVDGERTITLITNGVEHSPTLVIDPKTFGPENVPSAFAAVNDLPAEQRPPLAPDTDVNVLLVARVTRAGVTTDMPEAAAAAVRTWITDVARNVLRADEVRVEILAS